MILDSVKNEFKIYVIEPNKASSDALCHALEESGFHITAFLTAEDALENLKKEPPHIIVTHTDLPQMTGLALLKRVKYLSDDILVILITSNKSQGIQTGAYECIDQSQIEANLINVLNRAIEKLYLQFQNEQLLEELKHHQTSQSVNQSTTDQHKPSFDPIHQMINKISVLTSTNEVICCLTDQLFNLMGQPTLYLKYVPSHTSLLLTHLSGLDINNFKNAGIPLKGEPNSYLEKIKHPHTFDLLQNFITSVFQVESCYAIPITVDKNILGVVVILNKIKDQYKNIINVLLDMFKGFLEKAYFQEKMQSLMAFDLSTGAYNKKYFTKILDQEINRAVRIRHPVSLLYMGIDDFDFYVQRNGEQMGDILLKMVVHICVKTSRKIDLMARFQKGEFVILLPHTDKDKAMIKAERFRRTIFNAKFPYSNYQPSGHLSISIGISEYPTLSQDAISLIQVADNAFYQVKQSTKNRTCIGIAPKGFKPEFTYLVNN